MRLRGPKVYNWAGISGTSLPFAVARGTLERYDVALHIAFACQRRERVDRFLAPLRHHALVAQPELEAEQLADVGRRGVSFGKAFVQQPFEALVTVAVVFQARHQVGAEGLDVDAVERDEPDQEVV